MIILEFCRNVQDVAVVNIIVVNVTYSMWLKIPVIT